jgi:hypothetical protein
MPAANWAFERALAEAGYAKGYKAVEHICVERDWQTLLSGLDFMPGMGRNKLQLDLGIGPVEGFASRNTKILSCGALDLMGVRKADRKAFSGNGVRDSGRRWANIFKLWNCAWFDFFGPISRSVFWCMKKLPAHLNHLTTAPAPVAITYMRGRDQQPWATCIQEGIPRDQILLWGLNYSYVRGFMPWKAELVETKEFKSVNGTNMACSMFLMRQAEQRQQTRYR